MPVLTSSSDVQELLDHGARVVILSRGMLLRLRICAETLDLLSDREVATHVEKTRAAVELYNRLREAELVGGLFHSTC